MKTVVTILCLFALCVAAVNALVPRKTTIGETAWIGVEGVPFPYLARIDTGARVTSMHAMNLTIEKGSDTARENIGKKVSFQTRNRDGKSMTIIAPIVEVSTVKNSQGVEQRYVIELLLSWKDIQKKVAVNLRDRSRMNYKLLIGRNWLSKDFLVDVDIKASGKGEQ